MADQMAAIIRCVAHLDPDTLSEDDFLKEYCRAEYFMKLAHHIEYKQT